MCTPFVYKQNDGNKKISQGLSSYLGLDIDNVGARYKLHQYIDGQVQHNNNLCRAIEKVTLFFTVPTFKQWPAASSARAVASEPLGLSILNFWHTADHDV